MGKCDVLAVILSGGDGSGLQPLTRDRTTPAVPFAGKYRLIDIPMSNCLHSGIEKIAILTQFNSVSLHRHIHSTYIRDMFTRGWVQILAAEQTFAGSQWYQGTADAVRKQADRIHKSGQKYTLILAGDHLYLMDYRPFLQQHIDSQADITIAVNPVNKSRALDMGLLKLDGDGQVTRFVEKPTDEAVLEEMAGETGKPKAPYLASMGIYLFNTATLLDMLAANQGNDFGRDILPQALQNRRVMGAAFNDYWEDIGTIRRFYEVNLNMAEPLPDFNLYDPNRPIYTRPRFLPGSKVEHGTLTDVLLADGCRIQDATIRYSVIGLRSIIWNGVNIQRTIVMGADAYETDDDRRRNRELGRPDMGVGPYSVIDGAILDKNVRIGQQVIIRHDRNRPDEEHENWVARDGLVIVPKNAIIPDGTVI